MTFTTHFAPFPSSFLETSTVSSSFHGGNTNRSDNSAQLEPMNSGLSTLPISGGDSRWPQLPTPEYPPTQQDWDNYRNIFTQLYRLEERPLKEVKELLEQRYGFRATDRMYKRRIHDWKVMKNYKRGQKEAVCRALQRRGLAGKDHHQIMIRNQPAKVHRILRHIQNSGGRVDARLLSPSSASTEDNEIEVRTPERGSSLDDHASLWSSALDLFRQFVRTPSPGRPILTQDDLGKAEILCLEAVKYFEILLPFNAPAQPETGSTNCRDPSHTIFQIETASTLLGSKRYAEARTLLSRAFDELKDQLQEQPPALLVSVLQAGFYFINENPHFRIRDLFFDHVTGLCEIYLGARHPITVILQTSRNMNRNYEVLNALLDCLLNTASQNTEGWEAHDLSIRIIIQKAVTLGQLRNFSEAERALQRALRVCTSVYGVDHPSSLDVLRGLANLKAYDLQDYSGARTMFQEILLASEREDNAQTAIAKLWGFWGLGHIAYNESEFAKAEVLLRAALKLSVEIWGVEDSHTTNTACDLERTLRMCRKELEADNLRDLFRLKVDSVI